MNDGRVHRHQPGLAELGLLDDEDAGLEIDIISLQRDRFRDANAGACKETEDGGVRVRAQRVGWAQTRGRRHELA
jgi:hypothetical protein